MNQESSLRVSQTVWPWRAPAAAARAGRMPRPWRAALQAAVIAGVATLFLLVGRRYGISIFLYTLSAVVLISGLFVPVVFNWFEKIGAWLGKGVGIALTWLLLTPFFYLCVFPGRLFLLLLGKDPMCRRRESRKDSYWTDRKPSAPGSYTRQY